MKPASIYRKHQQGNWTTVPNDLIADPQLSWKAKAVLIYLLSKPENWTARNVDIQAHATDGPYAVTSALRELCEVGYMRRVRERKPDGTWETITELADYERWVGNDGEPDAEIADGSTRDNRDSPDAETACGPHAKTASPNKTEQVTKTKNKTERTRALSVEQIKAWRPDETLSAWTRETNPALSKADLAQWADNHVAKGTKIKDPAASWKTWVRNSLRYGTVAGSPKQTAQAGSLADRLRAGYADTQPAAPVRATYERTILDVEPKEQAR